MWESKLLRDLCTDYKSAIVDGPFGSNLKREHYTTEGIPVLKIQNIKEHHINDKKIDYVTPIKADELKRHAFIKGDIVMTKLGDPLGVSAIVEDIDNGIIVADLVRIRADKVNTKFLCYQLNSPDVQSAINRQQKGATRPRVKISMVRDLPINVPPLDKQKRIVGVLDEAFAGIDAAIAHTQQNLANARELFESTLNQIFTQKGEGWVTGTLADIGGGIKTGPFGSLLHKSDYIENGTPLVNPSHIIKGDIIPDVRKTISNKALEKLNSYRLKEGDIVIGRRGDMGRCAAVTKKEDGWLCGTGCFIITPKNNNNAEFLSLLLQSSYYIKEITKLASGATMLNLSNKALGTLKVSLPSVQKQSEILEHIENFTVDEKELNNLYTQKLNALKELKQSLLQKAFAGELTANMKQAA